MAASHERRNPTGDPPAPRDQETRRRRHRRKARRRTLLRLVALVLAVALGAVLWRHWDTLAPDKLLIRLRDSMSDNAGGFPVDISGSGTTLLGKSQNYSVTLSDSYLIYYNSKGAELSRYSCTYSAAVLRTAGKYVLVAEPGGKRLQLTTRSLSLAEISTDRSILSVSLNAKGQFAVLTDGAQGYAATVTVYDRQGKQIYSLSRRQLATEVTLAPGGDRLALLSPTAENGVINTTVEVFSLSSAQAEATYTATANDTLLYRLEYAGGRLCAVGETGALIMDEADPTPLSYTPQGKRVLGYAAGTGGLALAVRNYGDTDGGQIILLNTAGEQLCTVDFTGAFRHLSADGDRYLLLTDARVQLIGAGGVLAGTAVPADGQQAVASGSTAIVLGLSSLQNYPLTE